MARIRTVKPEFYKHLGLYEAEIDFGLPLRVAFSGLWTCSDREGRFPWIPRQLKIDILPYDDCDFSRVLHALATRGFVVKYACYGREYGYIPSWKTHQFINNKEPFTILPEPTDENVQLPCNQDCDACATREPRVANACVTRSIRKGREGKGNITTTLELQPPFEAFMDAAGRYTGKPTTTTPVPPPKRKRQTRIEKLSPYPAVVSETVNEILNLWPTRQPKDNTPIPSDVSALAERVDGLLKEPDVTKELLLQSARKYLAQPKAFFKHAHFFFGPGNGTASPWIAYARMTVHEDANTAVQGDAE